MKPSMKLIKLQLLGSFHYETKLSYFRATWLNCLYALAMWNKFDKDFYHWTNNHVESWHAALKHKLPNAPNIYILITALKGEEASTQITLAKQCAGDTPPPRRQKYAKFEKSLHKITELFKNGELSLANYHTRVHHFVRKFK